MGREENRGENDPVSLFVFICAELKTNRPYLVSRGFIYFGSSCLALFPQQTKTLWRSGDKLG